MDLLRPERGGVFVDATLGLGGHSKLMLERAALSGKAIRIIGIDQDEEAMDLARQELGDKVEYVQANFAQLDQVLAEKGIAAVDGILMDLGVSSLQLDSPDRGFSFQANGPLDMRMDQEGPVTAATIVNTWQEIRLADLFFRYGEERLSRKIARAIVEDRKKTLFEDTESLASLIVRLYPPALRYKRPHPATRVFQALRIEVNQELAVLEEGLTHAVHALAPGGVLAVISFHSLEDRIVKHFFRDKVTEGGYEILTKKPIEATEEEMAANPRSRSAKLRGIQRTQ